MKTLTIFFVKIEFCVCVLDHARVILWMQSARKKKCSFNLAHRIFFFFIFNLSMYNDIQNFLCIFPVTIEYFWQSFRWLRDGCIWWYMSLKRRQINVNKFYIRKCLETCFFFILWWIKWNQFWIAPNFLTLL